MSRRLSTKNVILVVLLIILIFRKLNRNIQYVSIDRFLPDMKNVLVWTDVSEIKDDGQNEFVEKKCKYFNCFVTKNRTLYGDTRYFDAVLFNSRDVSEGSNVPEERGSFQKYIFVATDSADNHPICHPIYDDYFNWTWTYRYESTITYRFFTIYNIEYEELGSHFRWYDMQPVDNVMKTQFVTKSKAAVVFLDRCKTRSNREAVISNLQMNLVKYNLTVDVFGKCGPHQCRRKTMNTCLWRLKKTYHFYLAFEDSIAHDYITDIVLHAYNNNAVPIVYGGAEYDRYLPPGSYIDASSMSSKELADTINYLLRNKEEYYNYFRYKRYYFFRKVEPLDICKLCEVLNRPGRLIQPVTHYNFRRWWNPSYKERCHNRNGFL